MIITTKFFGPTETKSSRVIAYSGADEHGTSFPWDHALGPTENHKLAAAKRFAKTNPATAIKSSRSYTLPDASNHAMVHILNQP